MSNTNIIDEGILGALQKLLPFYAKYQHLPFQQAAQSANYEQKERAIQQEINDPVLKTKNDYYRAMFDDRPVHRSSFFSRNTFYGELISSSEQQKAPLLKLTARERDTIEAIMNGYKDDFFGYRNVNAYEQKTRSFMAIYDRLANFSPAEIDGCIQVSYPQYKGVAETCRLICNSQPGVDGAGLHAKQLARELGFRMALRPTIQNELAEQALSSLQEETSIVRATPGTNFSR